MTLFLKILLPWDVSRRLPGTEVPYTDTDSHNHKLNRQWYKGLGKFLPWHMTSQYLIWLTQALCFVTVHQCEWLELLAKVCFWKRLLRHCGLSQKKLVTRSIFLLTRRSSFYLSFPGSCACSRNSNTKLKILHFFWKIEVCSFRATNCRPSECDHLSTRL